jgi:hypothetical protein
MMSPLPIDDRYDTRDSRWLAAGPAQARIRSLNSQPTAPPTLSRTVPAARSPLQVRQCHQTKPPQHLRRSYILLPDPAANSP